MADGASPLSGGGARCSLEIETSRCIFRMGHPGLHLLVHIYGPEVITSGEGLVPPEDWVYEPELPDDGRRARETLVEEWGIYWTDELIRWLVRERRADQPSPSTAPKKGGAPLRAASHKPAKPSAVRRPAATKRLKSPPASSKAPRKR